MRYWARGDKYGVYILYRKHRRLTDGTDKTTKKARDIALSLAVHVPFAIKFTIFR